MKIYDSRDFAFCDLCGEVIVGETPQMIESNGEVNHISDLQISHRHCWELHFGEHQLPGTGV